MCILTVHTGLAGSQWGICTFGSTSRESGHSGEPVGNLYIWEHEWAAPGFFQISRLTKNPQKKERAQTGSEFK